tara:strand:- start:1316 stop:1942 length:627 start_codon:yes stop_codon:yes gene_type:complete
MPNGFVTVIPDDVVGSPATDVWELNIGFGGTRDEAIDADDGPYITANSEDEEVSFTFTDPGIPSNHKVTAYNAVRVYVESHASNARAPNTVTLEVDIKDTHGNVLNTDSHTVTVNAGEGALYSGAAEEYADSGNSTAWTLATTKNFQVTLRLADMDQNGNGVNGHCSVHHLYAKISYEYDDFYPSESSNVDLKEGMIVLKNGIMELKY